MKKMHFWNWFGSLRLRSHEPRSHEPREGWNVFAPLDDLAGQVEEEKQQRVYYQDLLYQVCNHIDKRIGGVTVCGTHKNQESNVIKRLRIATDWLSQGEQ